MDEVLKLKKTVLALEEDKVRLKTQNIKLELEVSRVLREHEDLANGKGSAQGAAAARNAHMVVALRRKLKTVEKSQTAKDDELGMLKRDARISRVQELERENGIFISEVRRLQHIVLKLGAEIAEFEVPGTISPEAAAKIAALESSKAGLEERAERLEEDLGRAQREVAEAQLQVKTVKREFESESKAKVAKALAERDRLATQDTDKVRSSMQSRLEDLQSANRRLTLLLDEETQKRHESDAEIKTLKRQLETARLAAAQAGSASPRTRPSSASKPAAKSSSTREVQRLEHLTFHCQHRYMRTTITTDIGIQWVDFMRKLKQEFAGASGFSYDHSGSKTDVQSVTAFEKCCNYVEDLFVQNGTNAIDISVLASGPDEAKKKLERPMSASGKESDRRRKEREAEDRKRADEERKRTEERKREEDRQREEEQRREEARRLEQEERDRQQREREEKEAAERKRKQAEEAQRKAHEERKQQEQAEKERFEAAERQRKLEEQRKSEEDAAQQRAREEREEKERRQKQEAVARAQQSRPAQSAHDEVEEVEEDDEYSEFSEESVPEVDVEDDAGVESIESDIPEDDEF